MAKRVCVALACWVAAPARAEDAKVAGLIVDRDGKGIEDAGVLFFAPPGPAPIVRVPGSRFEVPLDQLSGPLTEKAADEALRLARAPEFKSSTLIGTARTDAWGRYWMPGLRTDTQAIFSAGGVESAFRGEEGKAWPMTLRVGPPATLVVKERTERVPIAGAEVTMIPLAPRRGPIITTHTDGLGRVPLLMSGQMVLAIVRAKGFLPMALLHREMPWPHEEVLLPAPARIRGRVVEAGRPAAGAFVEVIGAFTPRVVTDGDGAFTIPSATWGAELRADRRSSLGFGHSFTPGPLEIKPGAQVRVDLTDATTGAPVAASVRSFSFARTDAVVEERPGRYLTPSIPQGSGRLELRAEGYVPATVDFEVRPPARTELGVALVPLLPLSVVLRHDQRRYPTVKVQPVTSWKTASVKGGTLLQWQQPCAWETVDFNAHGGHTAELPAGRYLLRFTMACDQAEEKPQLTHRGCEGPRMRALTVRRCPVFEQLVTVPAEKELEFTVPPGGWR